MQKKPLVTCIVPVLNENETILDFILSLHKQDYRPIELLIVDGGSKDNTIDIVNKAIEDLNDEFFSIKLFKEEDFGTIASPANARNIGLDIAGGEFIFFIDSDTCFIDKSTISTAITKIGERDFIIIRFKPLIDTKLEEHISKTMKLDGLLIYRKRLIDKIRFIPTLGFGEDREFNHRLFGNFGFSDQIPCTIFIGRHYPHTKKELRKQNEWYGRTIVNYMKVIYGSDKNEFLRQSAFVLYNILLAIFPIAVVASLTVSIEAALILIFLFLAMILLRFFKYGYRTLNEYVFLIWYSLYNALFFTKGLLSKVYKKNIFGRV